MDLASAEAEIRHVFGDTPITEASIGAAPPDILVKLSENNSLPLATDLYMKLHTELGRLCFDL